MKIYTGINTTMMESDTYKLLGEFIRTHRERLPPPATLAGRRRTPGMRREELAEAAGISTTWITWLEQGRNVTASVITLSRLADALHLTPAERASLFDLAGKRDPHATLNLGTDLPPDVLALPEYITVPAYLLDHTWTACAWNSGATQLFTGWLDDSTQERNLLRYVFLSPAARTLLDDWEKRVQRLVAEFRADYSRHPNDTAVVSLITTLSEQSPPFVHYWNEQSVLYREGGERHFHHPRKGIQHFVQTTWQLASHPNCKLVCLTPRHTHEK